MKMRLLEKKDVKHCSAIVGKNYSRKWQILAESDLESVFSDSLIKPVYWIAEDGGRIVGFAGYIHAWMDYNIYQICWVNVLPEFQGKGIGKKLVAKLISEIRKKKHAALIELTASTPNANYYKKHFGFKTVDTFKGSYPNHLMSLSLKKGE